MPTLADLFVAFIGPISPFMVPVMVYITHTISPSATILSTVICASGMDANAGVTVTRIRHLIRNL